MSKTPVSEGFRQKVKQFFGGKKGNVLTSSLVGPRSEGVIFRHELLQEIGRDSPLANRVKVLREVCDFLQGRRLEDHAVETGWTAVEDLLHPNCTTEARHIALHFLTIMVTNEFEKLGLLRTRFFFVVAQHKIPADVIPRLELLKALSDDGKDISYFEEHIGPFLLSWMPAALQGGKSDMFLPLLINVIKYNSSYLDDGIVTGFVREICRFSWTAKEETDVELSLNTLDAVVRYSCLPSNSLYEFIAAVCRTVNIEKFCHHSWKIMRNLLGTHLAHSGVQTMCSMMEECSSGSNCDVMLLRGAVFFIGMCLWGSQRVTTLKHSHASVLPSVLQALSCGHSVVAVEAALSIQRLVKKYGSELHIVAWDAVLDITEAIQGQIEKSSPVHNPLVENLNILLNYIEDLYENDRFNGPDERFFGIVERCASERPETSLHILVAYKAQTVHPSKHEWLSSLKNLLEKYFRYEILTSVRVKVLDVLSFVLTSYRHWYEEELLDVAVLPYLSQIPEDQDVTVRTHAVQLLLDLAQSCESSKCTDLLNIVEKVISRHVELQGKTSPLEQVDQQLSQEEKELKDVKTAVNGLVEVFKTKLFCIPRGHAQQAFELLVSHLKAHYYHGYSTYIASLIRNLTFECFLSLRCDAEQRLGHLTGNKENSTVKFSPYYLCAQSERTDLKNPTSCPLTFISYAEVFDAIVNCLQYEVDWTVLEQVLSGLPSVLQNKTLVLSANPNLNAVSSVLCKMVSGPSCINDLRRVPSGVGRGGFNALVFPVLTVLATYHRRLDRPHQSELVKTLELGLVSKCASLCVTSLTLCTMEMQAVMKSLLPSILARLCQISATVMMAVPMLEFLSGLVHLPHLYASFQDSQYKSVFAICLPYTDPFKYSQYTVTLGYHVIAAWFVRSRITYRKGFVGFISKGIKSNVKVPERVESRPESPSLTGPRSRSSSMNLSQQHSPQLSRRSASPVTPPVLKETEAACEFHSEMNGVCLDMMARYTFAPCFSQPHRTSVVEFMLSNGHSKSWMIGNTTVTITTSGSFLGLDGVCKNCLSLRGKMFPKTHEVKSGVTSKTDPDITGQVEEPKGTEQTRAEARDQKNELRESSFEGSVVSSLSYASNKSDVSDESNRVSEVSQLISTKYPSKDGEFPTENEKTKAEVSSTSCDTWQTTSTSSKRSLDYSKTQEPIEASYPSPMVTSDMSDQIPRNCQCVCQGWAEVLIRRPSGNISWIMRLQNRPTSPGDLDMCDSDIWWSSADDPRILNFSTSPDGSDLNLRGPDELLSTSTESGSVLIDVIKQPQYNMDKKDETEPREGAKRRTKSGLDTRPKHDTSTSDPVLFYTPTQSGDQSPNTNPDTPDTPDTPCSVESDLESRERLLSRSPARGPSVIRMTDSLSLERADAVLRASPHEVVAEDQSGRTLHFEKPELGVSLVSLSSVLTSRDHTQEQDKPRCGVQEPKYLSSSEMYRLASDEESIHSFDIELEPSASNEEQEPIVKKRTHHSPTKKKRPKSLNLETCSVRSHSIINENPELAEEAIDAEITEQPALNSQKPADTNQATTPQSVESNPNARTKRRSQGAKSSLRKTQSLRLPVEIRHSSRSPFTLPRQSRSSLSLGLKETDDITLRAVTTKCTSSPELSTPTATFARALAQTNADSDRTPSSRKRLLKRSSSARTPKSKESSDTPPSRDPAMLVPPSESHRYPLDPSFVFLQLYHASFLGPTQERPLPLPEGEKIELSIKCLDRIPPYDTHKIGIIYVGPGQHDNEAAILRNVYGSSRYVMFLAGLGSLVRLRDCPAAEIYTGGLDRDGNDGEFAYSWQDDICQIIFHVATLMPNRESDPGCNSKKMHIGNDFVTIVYNDSDEEVKFGTIKGQFNFAEVLIKPLDNESNLVKLRFKEGLKELFLDTGVRTISDTNLAMLVRQLAVHVNMASVIHQSQRRQSDAYGCNWLERLRHMKRLRSKALAETVVPTSPLGKTPPGGLGMRNASVPDPTDFTEYITR